MQPGNGLIQRALMNLIRNLGLILASTLVTLLLLEAILRSLPVTEVARNRPLKAGAEPFDVASRPNRTYHASSGWNFKNARARHINNYGFFSDYDYRPGYRGLLTIGDSYVEAVAVDFAEAFHQRLAAQLGVEVYNIGLSGSPLSQYEAYLSQACREFSPTQVIIPIVANDFGESIYRYRIRDGFFHYREDGSLLPTPYPIGRLRRFANGSSLVKYVYFNLNVGLWLRTLSKPAFAADGLEVPPATRPEDEALARKQWAARLFLERLDDHCLAPMDILLVLDADRHAGWGIYGPEPMRSEIFRFMSREAQRAGYPVLDLQPVMQTRFEQNGQRFEFHFDGHWNAMAHRVVADAILVTGFLPSPPSTNVDSESSP